MDATLRGLVLGTALAALALPAAADLTVCNKTGYTASVAVGYRDGEQWTSEGWWNIDGGDCAVLISGDLKQRYYYLHAEHHEIGGGWGGDYKFCTSENKFTIVGDQSCSSRGYAETGFFEVDTGDSATDFTQNLVDN